MTSFPHDSVVMVTGGGRGIGRAISRAVAAAGATVVVTYRGDEEAARRTVADIALAGGTADAVQMDVTDEQAVRRAFTGVRRQWGRLDGLVNNAGRHMDALFPTMSLATFREVIDTNLVGTFLTNREAVRIMANQRSGAIVNVTTASIHRPIHGQTNYVAAKSGVLAMTRCIALEAATYNIRANVVAPGFVMTDMTRALERELDDRFLDAIPLRRLATPEEIAPAVAFLLSDDASYITGTELVLDGGTIVNIAQPRARRARPGRAHPSSSPSAPGSSEPGAIPAQSLVHRY